jgi:DNA-binding winged helix-turn-helix (wHTH) protein/TolB-like protein/Flp pilus assembly protein TadD
MGAPVRGYGFADFRLEPAKRRLTGPDGVIPLSARAFDVLVHLVENRDRVVSKDELLKAVWPHSVVEDNNLNQAITGVRRALGDSRETPRCIATIAGRGYQFIGDVTRLDEADAVVPTIPDAGSALQVAARADVDIDAVPSPLCPTSERDDLAAARAADTSPPADPLSVAAEAPVVQRGPGVSRRTILGGLGAAAIAAVVAGVLWWRRGTPPGRPKSIAVLPFRPLLPDAGNAAIELGVTEQLINRLSRIPGVVITPLNSVMPFASGSSDPLEAGRKLGVDAVVDGHVQVQDQRVRLSARLVAVDGGAALWANSFTETLGELLAVQDSLAMQLSSAIASELSDEARARVMAKDTADVEAWQLYANGRVLIERRNAAGFERAIEYFDASLRRDPRFARASAWLSDTHVLAAVFGMAPPKGAFESARRAANRALELDSTLPDAHVAMGHVYTQFDRNFASGRGHYLRALQLDPGFAKAMVQMALNVCQTGDLAAAREYIRRAQAREPGSMAVNSVSGWIAYNARAFQDAERELSRIVEAAPDATLPRQFLARVMLVQKRGAEVVRLLEGRSEPAPTSFSNLGRAYAQAGNAVGARSEIDRLEALGMRGFGVGFDLALLHLELGDRDRALAALERGVDDFSQTQGYINVEPALDPLRAEPRFRAVVRRTGLA